MKSNLLLCLGFLFTANLGLAQPAETAVVAKQLQAYYEKGTVRPGLRQPKIYEVASGKEIARPPAPKRR